MKFLNRPQQLNALTRTGLVFLIFANAARFLMLPSSRLPRSLADAIVGLFYGVAIGLLLWGIVRSRNRRQCKQLES
jgi:uncharacterized protein involved in response to NO